MYQKNLDMANAIVKNLQAENEYANVSNVLNCFQSQLLQISLLLDAMFLADPGLCDRYFFSGPGLVSSPLDPYMYPESAFTPSVPPLLLSSSQAPQHARYQLPPNPYPHPTHPPAVQAIAGTSSFSSHHPQRPHHLDHQPYHHHISKKRRSDVGPLPPEELELVGMPPANNANPSSLPTTVDFDPQSHPYRRTSRSSSGHHTHPFHLNGNGGDGVGPSGPGENGIGHVRSLEVCQSFSLFSIFCIHVSFLIVAPYR
jgi:hypothetical protein